MQCLIPNACVDKALCCAFCKEKCADRCKDIAIGRKLTTMAQLRALLDETGKKRVKTF